MATKDDILNELLNRGGYISGEELAKKFGVSRAAVWKAIKALQSGGYKIDAVTNKGYSLYDANKIVTAARVKSGIKYDVDVIHYHSIDSTNNECKRMLADGKKGVFLVSADNQTAGRGRQGKSFYSPAETGIYFSLVIRPDSSLQNAVTATTAASVAVCKAIEGLTDLQPKIKWVNDVYVNGKKVCGILTEANTDVETGTVDSVIIGIGVNISTIEFPDDISGAGSLGVDINRSALIAETVNNLLAFAGGGYAEFIDYYRSRSMVIGRQIRCIQNGVATEARAISIDPRGGLEVEFADKTRAILRSGEISIRPIDDEK